ncbi:MAG: MCE family protein [candidate division NC10 bacterium]|nr:MCE family protein [candidate division NC10 bacterium]MBI2563254.1 MCE family protein [candidate division NC10 bacterium]
MAMSREVRVGLFLVVAFLILIALFELVGKETIFARMVEYRSSFKAIPGLKLGDPVRLAGVDVGTVRDIRVIGARVEVVVRVKPGTPVKTDSIATIKLTSLLGTNFVDLTFGSPAAQVAPPGSLLQSSEPPDLNTLLARLNDAAGDVQTLAKQVNEGLGKSIEPISAAFQSMDKIAKKIEKGEGTLGRLITDDGLYREIRGIAGNLSRVSEQIAKGEGTLGKMVADDQLYKDLRTLTTDLRGTAGSFTRVMKDIESGKGSLGKLVRDETFYNEAREALTGLRTVSKRITEGKGTLGKLVNDEALYTDMKGAVASLNGIMKKVERGEGTLGKLVNDDSLYFTAKDSLKKVGKGADQLREQGPLSIIGIGIQALGAF